MSRSGTYTSTFTLNGLITAAFQLANIYQSEDTVSSADYNVALILLNSMIKDWEGDGIKLWKRRQAVLFTAKATNSYTLGSSGQNCTNSFVNTTLTSAAAISATTLALVSTGMTVGDYIGIELTAGTRQWTTIATIPGSTSVTISTGLISAAALGNTVVTYTTKINRPLKITRANTYNLNTASESIINMISYDEYFDLPIKTTAGKPNNFYYDKLLDNGVIYVFPTPSDVKEIVKFTYYDSIMDMTSTTDNFDFPQEWNHTILYNLTVELCYAYQKFVELDKYEVKANQLKQKAKQWDGDEESLKISTKRH